MTNNNFKIGVFGLGSIGLRHAMNLVDMGYDVMGFDPSPERQGLLVEKGGQAGSKDDVLNFSDAVVIATPSEHHLSDLELCLDSGKHAFVEKPLSHTLDGLEVLEAKAKAKNLIVAIGMNIRLNTAIIYLKEQLDKGALGKALWGEYTLHSYLPDWRPHQDHRDGYAADPKTGGVIFDVVHGFDVIHHLLGAYDVKGAIAQCSGTLDIPSDDCADIICEHESGVTSRLHMDYITKPKEHTLTIATDKGFSHVDISHRRYTFTDVNSDIVEDLDFTDTGVNDDYKLELQHFAEVCQGQDHSICGIDEAAKILKQAINARSIAGLPHG